MSSNWIWQFHVLFWCSLQELHVSLRRLSLRAPVCLVRSRDGRVTYARCACVLSKRSDVFYAIAYVFVLNAKVKENNRAELRRQTDGENILRCYMNNHNFQRIRCIRHIPVILTMNYYVFWCIQGIHAFLMNSIDCSCLVVTYFPRTKSLLKSINKP